MEINIIDLFFLLSFFGLIAIGYGIYRKFYTSIEEIMATTELKKSRAMQYRAEHLVSSLKNSIYFCIILSLGTNVIALLLYSWITTEFFVLGTIPEFSYFFFFYSSLIVLMVYPLGEVYYLCEKENEAETPHHKILRSIIRKLVAKVKGKTEAVIVFALIFYVTPVLILSFGIGLELLFSMFIVAMIYPMIIVIYFISYAIYKLFIPLIFLHNFKNISIYIGALYLVDFSIFEVGLFLNSSIFVTVSLLALLFVLIYGIVKDLKYRPGELSHIIDDLTRPFEWAHGAFLVLGFGMFTFSILQVFIMPFPGVGLTFIPLTMNAVLKILLIGVSFLIPIFLFIIIISKARYYSRALVITLTYDSMKLNAAIKSQLITDKTLIESIEKSVDQNYIRPEYTPKLYKLLQNEDVHIRRKAIIILRKITEDDRFKSVSIVPNLLDFLEHDKIWTVRLEAAESLMNMMKILPKVEVKKIHEFLSKLKPDKNRYVRWGIVKLYNSIAFARDDLVDDVMSFLYKGLEDEEWSVRKGTVESFNQIVDDFPKFTPEILKRSLKLAKDDDTDIIQELFNLILKITGTEVNEDNLATLKSQINEIIKTEPTFNVSSLQEALDKIKATVKAPKFVFKKSDLPKS